MNILNYDPNLTSCGNMAKQTVKLVFAQWDYRAEFTTQVGGNCTGFTVIESAIENMHDDLSEGPESLPEIILTRENGDKLYCEDEEDKVSGFLKDMLIYAEIIDIQPKSENE